MADHNLPMNPAGAIGMRPWSTGDSAGTEPINVYECGTCHALVTDEAWKRHGEWHDSVDDAMAAHEGTFH